MTEKANHSYWQTKAGDDYDLTQRHRRRTGMSNYDAQEKWLATYLGGVKDRKGSPVRLLDFGCGFGRIAQLCAGLGDIDYHGFDFSEAMVRPFLEAPPAPYAADIERRIIVGSTVNGAYPPKSFDVILTISVMIHNEETDVRRIFSELSRIRQDDGEIVLIETPPSSRSVMLNGWHGGCWAHDYSLFAGDNLNLTIDDDIHQDHAAYIFSTPRRFSWIRNGQRRDFALREEMLTHFPEPFISSTSEDALGYARRLDAQEALQFSDGKEG